MAATLKDVARYAGVSPSTVSRVVRGLPIVSERVRKRVNEAIAEVGYRPDASARSVRTGSSHAVGFVVPDISNWFYSMVFSGAQDLLYQAGYDLILATSNGDLEREKHAVDSLLSRRVDGLILSLVDEEATLLRDTVTGVPTTLLDRECDGIQADVVLSDHPTGMAAAVRHLVELGHRRIALLTGTKDLYTSRSRREAFRRTALHLGLDESDLFDIAGDKSVEAGEQVTLRLVNDPAGPTAIIAGSNQLLLGALRALQSVGLKCPEHISLIACEDSDIARVYRPAISAVGRSLATMGGTAATSLLNRLPQDGRRRVTGPGAVSESVGSSESPKSHVRIMLPTTFMARGSTGPAWKAERSR